VVEVAEGMENLEAPNHAERAMGLAPHQRLACQARIRSGHVRLRW
jgi:ferredoxin